MQDAILTDIIVQTLYVAVRHSQTAFTHAYDKAHINCKVDLVRAFGI